MAVRHFRGGPRDDLRPSQLLLEGLQRIDGGFEKEKYRQLRLDDFEGKTSQKPSDNKGLFDRAKDYLTQLSTAKKAVIILSTLAIAAGASHYLSSGSTPTIPLTPTSEVTDPSEVLDGKSFLVIHDNKPKGDEAAGKLLARIGIIDEKNGYTPVAIPEDSPLAASKDLETLIKRPGGTFISCQSNGKKCFEFGIETDEKLKPSANVLRTFKLNLPKGEYTNIEGAAITKDYAPRIFWSHRGDVNKFSGVPVEKQHHLDHLFSAPYSSAESEFHPEISKQTVNTPFLEKRVELRHKADHITTNSGEHLFVAAADPEETGTTDFDMFSIIHSSSGKSLYKLPGEKIEAMYLDENSNTLYLGSDNEGSGAKVCKLALGKLKSLGHKCVSILKGQEFGISGMAEIK